MVQNLPGVARSSFGSGELIIWGAAPNETRVNVDGVEIPALYHVGGFRSTINSDLVRSINLSPGSYGADYGRGLGGLVRIDLGPLPKEGTHGYVAADDLDASALLSTALTPRLRLAVAGRISYLDQLLPLVTSADVGDFVPIPRYDDYQARATLSLRHDEELALTFLASDDHLRRAIPSDDPSQVRSQNIDSGWKRVILRYARLLPDGASVVVTPSFGFDSASNQELFGSTPVDVRQSTCQYALRAAYRRRVGLSTTLSFGIDMQAQSSTLDRNGSLTLPAREGDTVRLRPAARATTSPPITGTCWSSTPPLTPSPRSPSAGSRWSRGCASSRSSSRGARRCRPAAPRRPAATPASRCRKIPSTISSTGYAGCAPLPAEPAHRGRVPRHQEADADRRAPASTGSRPIRRT